MNLYRVRVAHRDVESARHHLFVAASFADQAIALAVECDIGIGVHFVCVGVEELGLVYAETVRPEHPADEGSGSLAALFRAANHPQVVGWSQYQ